MKNKMKEMTGDEAKKILAELFKSLSNIEDEDLTQLERQLLRRLKETK